MKENVQRKKKRKKVLRCDVKLYSAYVSLAEIFHEKSDSIWKMFNSLRSETFLYFHSAEQKFLASYFMGCGADGKRLQHKLILDLT